VTVRTSVTAARRIVVKVGSSSLTSSSSGIDGPRLVRLVDALAGAGRGGRELILVSSGAIAAGLAPLGLARRPRDVATQQAAAGVGQGILVHRYTEAFARHGRTVAQVLLTAEDVVRRARYRNAQRTLYRLLDLGVVPVVNENDTVATDELRFGDNDRLAALVAHLVHADLLVLLSDVAGLYDGHPSLAGSRLVPEVLRPEDLDGLGLGGVGPAGVGTGGMVTKIDAARIATSAGIPTVLASAEAAVDALAGQPGFHPAAVARPRVHPPRRPAAGRGGDGGRGPAAGVPAGRRRHGGGGRLRRR
jgi:glutamate 5-kinase